MPPRTTWSPASGLWRLVLDRPTATVTTFYALERWTGGGTVPEDRTHGDALGLSPLEHRLHHELAHHLVARARGVTIADGCRVLWRDAHHAPQQEPEAGTDEWFVTAVQYHARHRTPPNAGHYGALIDLARGGADPEALAARLRWAFDARLHATAVVLP